MPCTPSHFRTLPHNQFFKKQYILFVSFYFLLRESSYLTLDQARLIFGANLVFLKQTEGPLDIETVSVKV